jgi:hypothetical protein
MLSHAILRNHAGLMLTGDYWTLHALHEMVHDINERSPLVKDKEGIFLGLAYDVRKAFEGQREIIKPPKHTPEFGVRYGVKILWPTLLLQQHIIRTSLAFLDHGRRYQALTYALEAAIEEGLMEDFGALGPKIIKAWGRLNGSDPNLLEKLHGRAGLFCSWSKSQRARGFLALIESFDPMFERLYPLQLRSGEKPLLSPSDFEGWESTEWPDPKWG